MINPAPTTGENGNGQGSDPAPERDRRTLSDVSAATAVLAVVLIVLCLVIMPTGAMNISLCYVAYAAAALTLLLAARPFLRSSRPEAVSPRWTWLPWCLTALALYLLLALIPLPLRFGAVPDSPRAQQNAVAADMIDAIESLELVPPSPRGFALTRNRAGSARWSMMALTAMLVALVAAGLPLTARLIALRALLVVGALVGVGGILSLTRHPQGDTLWWIYLVDHGLPGPVACFRNRNHFAALLAMLAPVALALAVFDLGRLHVFRALLSLTAFAVCATGTLLTLSRGATLSLAVGLVVCFLCLLRYRRWIMCSVLAALGIIGLVVGLQRLPDDVTERLASLRNLRTDDSYQTRVAGWRDSGRILAAYPIAGAGANGFRIVYPQHRTTTQSAEMTHAENEYIQWAVDGGAIGILLALAALAAFVWEALWPALRARDDTLSPAVVTASVSAAAVVGANAFIDYPLHIPLYTITAAAVIGCLLPVRVLGTHRRVGQLPALLIAAVCVAVTVTWGGRQHYDQGPWLRRAPLDALCRALTWAPGQPVAWLAMGERLSGIYTPEARLLARQSFERAGALDPNSYRLWEELGYAHGRNGNARGARKAFARVKELRDWKWVPEIPQEAP